MNFLSTKNNNFTNNHYSYHLSSKKFKKLEKLYYDKIFLQNSVWIIKVENDYYEFICKNENNINVKYFCDRNMIL